MSEECKPCDNSTVIKGWGWAIIVVLIIVILMVFVAGVVFSFTYVTNKTDTSKPASKSVRIPGVPGSGKIVTNPRLPRYGDDGTPGASNSQYQYVGNGRNLPVTRSSGLSDPRAYCGKPGTHSEVINGQCRCQGHYWGLTCELESYSPEFIAMGNLDLALINQLEDQMAVIPVDNIQECQDQCEDNCQGFFYRKNSCVLLDTLPAFTADQLPHYQPLVQSDLYLKKGIPLIITDRVYLYEGHQPLRYWQGIRENVIALEPGQLYHLPFIPDGWINPEKYDLAYSDVSFSSPRQAKHIQSGHQEFIPSLYSWVMIIPKRNR